MTSPAVHNQAQEALLENSRVIIIRHANSTFNLRWSEVEAEVLRSPHFVGGHK
jgi:nicotinamidase-related amidase